MKTAEFVQLQIHDRKMTVELKSDSAAVQWLDLKSQLEVRAHADKHPLYFKKSWKLDIAYCWHILNCYIKMTTKLIKLDI